MDFSTISSIISTVGFPVLSCLGLAMYIKKRDEQQTEDRVAEREMLLEEIKYNRQVNTELLATNRILAGDIKEELKDIKNEIQNLQDC